MLNLCANPNTAMPSLGPGTPSDIMVMETGTVIDVNVSITALHTYVGDLTWTLSKGNSSRILINRVTNGNGTCSTDNIMVTLDDESVGGTVQSQCNGQPPAISGNRTPNLPLSFFDNLAVEGTWTLTPNDQASGDAGTFQQWCLIVSYLP